MTNRERPVGPRGLAVLAVVAVVGIALAVQGWSNRHVPSALGSVGGGPSPAVSEPVATPARTASPPTSAPPNTGSPSPGTTAGPLLSSQSYAQYAFEIWPGPLSAAAKSAEIGLTITVRRQAHGLEVSAAANGQPAAPARLYRAGARVYVIEATLGDDSGSSDYNLGDDGLVVTDAKGRILQ